MLTPTHNLQSIVPHQHHNSNVASRNGKTNFSAIYTEAIYTSSKYPNRKIKILILNPVWKGKLEFSFAFQMPTIRSEAHQSSSAEDGGNQPYAARFRVTCHRQTARSQPWYQGLFPTFPVDSGEFFVKDPPERNHVFIGCFTKHSLPTG